MHKCRQIGDEVPIVDDLHQEGFKLTHIVRCRSLPDGVNVGRCYMNALGIYVVSKIVS